MFFANNLLDLLCIVILLGLELSLFVIFFKLK